LRIIGVVEASVVEANPSVTSRLLRIIGVVDVKASVVEANPSVTSRLSRISGVPVVKLPVVAVDPSVTSRFLRSARGVVEDSVVGSSVVDEAHSLA